MKNSKFLGILARPAGLEPATSWFVARTKSICRPLPMVASVCRNTDPSPAFLVKTTSRLLPPFAGVSRKLVLRKGKERARGANRRNETVAAADGFNRPVSRRSTAQGGGPSSGPPGAAAQTGSHSIARSTTCAK
jgi:hypothetical protein